MSQKINIHKVDVVVAVVVYPDLQSGTLSNGRLAISRPLDPALSAWCHDNYDNNIVHLVRRENPRSASLTHTHDEEFPYKLM